MMTANLDMISAANSVLVLVDYQPSMFRGVGSSDRALIMNAAVAAASAASILSVPTVFTAISPDHNGAFVSDIAGLFPGQEVYARRVPGFDAFEDEAVLAAVKKPGRKKIIVSGLWTSMCMAYTTLHGIREGFEVYGLIDAAGDATADAHTYGVQRMIQAGVSPITWMPLVSEWMHDWANPKAGILAKDVYRKFDPMIGM